MFLLENLGNMTIQGSLKKRMNHLNVALKRRPRNAAAAFFGILQHIDWARVARKFKSKQRRHQRWPVSFGMRTDASNPVKTPVAQSIPANSRHSENFPVFEFRDENYDESTLPCLAGRVFGVAAAVLFIAEEVAMRSKSSSTHQYHEHIHTENQIDIAFPLIVRVCGSKNAFRKSFAKSTTPRRRDSSVFDRYIVLIEILEPSRKRTRDLASPLDCHKVIGLVLIQWSWNFLCRDIGKWLNLSTGRLIEDLASVRDTAINHRVP